MLSVSRLTVTEVFKCLMFLCVAKVNADFGNLCDCPIACNSEEFDVKLSYTSFPNSPYGRQLGENLNISIPETNPGIPLYDSKTQYIRYLLLPLGMLTLELSSIVFEIPNDDWFFDTQSRVLQTDWLIMENNETPLLGPQKPNLYYIA